MCGVSVIIYVIVIGYFVAMYVLFSCQLLCVGYLVVMYWLVVDMCWLFIGY